MSIQDIENESGQPFRMRVVNNGDKYGRDMCLTHSEDNPLIEFYDRRYSHDVDPEGTPLGQFVSRYYLSTLVGEDGFRSTRSIFEAGEGLNLDGGRFY